MWKNEFRRITTSTPGGYYLINRSEVEEFIQLQLDSQKQSLLETIEKDLIYQVKKCKTAVETEICIENYFIQKEFK